MTNSEFTKAVDDICESEYGITDCGDLCYNLIAMCVIDIETWSVDEAARHCAQLMEQQ